jgi:hypothetical protein
MIKTWRAKLADGDQDVIRLSTNDGMIGYKIIKFECMAADTTKLQQSVTKIWTREQDTIDDNIDFSNSELMGANYYTKNDDTKYPISESTIFDNVIFNQDIFITHKDANAGEEINFYLELEQVKLDLSEATVATLKDMRGSN